MPYKYVPVAKEDTYKLIDAAQNGDRRARDLIVDQNIGLVKNLAMRYASGYYEPEDLMQDSWDWSKPSTGSTRAITLCFRPMQSR